MRKFTTTVLAICFTLSSTLVLAHGGKRYPPIADREVSAIQEITNIHGGKRYPPK